MIIHSHGKLKRKLIYSDAGNTEGKEEPCMVLYRKDVKGKCAIIPLNCAYKYDEPKGQAELATVSKEIFNIAHALDYPCTSQSMATILTTIQDGLGDLISMPYREKPLREIGEATVTVGGVRLPSVTIKE